MDKNETKHSYGIVNRLMYGMAEFYNGGCFVIIIVNVWTVNTNEHLMICKEYGADAVITNYPAKAKALYEG